MTRYRHCFLAFTLLLVASCGGGGGGGGGGGASASPSVTVSGVNASYWQDEAISISFSVTNMNASTTNYTISGLNEGYDFTLDSKAGTFRTLPNQYTDAGDYSYIVEARDGNGKTASATFEFRVDAVAIGSSYFKNADWIDPRGVEVRRSRDGFTSISASHFELSGNDSYVARNLTCFGVTKSLGSEITGALECGGDLPTDTGQFNDGDPGEFVPIENLELIVDVNQDYAQLAIYSSGGILLEIWENFSSEAEPLVNLEGWATNSELQGRYLPIKIGHQYRGERGTLRDAFLNGWSPFSSQDYQRGDGYRSVPFFPDFNSSPQLIVSEDYKISSTRPKNGSSACVIEGEISRQTIDEFDLVYGDKGQFWRDTDRQISGELTATNCSNLGSTVQDKTIDQALAPFLGSVREYRLSGGEARLEIEFFGAGLMRPYSFTTVKICNSDGTQTAVNADRYQIDCK